MKPEVSLHYKMRWIIKIYFNNIFPFIYFFICTIIKFFITLIQFTNNASSTLIFKKYCTNELRIKTKGKRMLSHAVDISANTTPCKRNKLQNNTRNLAEFLWVSRMIAGNTIPGNVHRLRQQVPRNLVFIFFNK